MQELISFTFEYESVSYRFELTAADDKINDSNVELTWAVSTSEKNSPWIDTKITFRVDLEMQSVMVVGLFGLTPTEACLAGCAAQGLVGPLIGCFSRNKSDYLKCLKTKGRSVTEDVLKCAIGCAAGAIGGGMGPAKAP